MRALQSLLAILLLACTPSSVPGTTAPSVTSSPSVVDVASDLVAKSCAGTTYTRCVASLTTAVGVFKGSTVAICEYANGEGDVVTVDASETPEDACSGGGLITPSRAHATVQIP